MRRKYAFKERMARGEMKEAVYTADARHSVDSRQSWGIPEEPEVG